MADLMVGDTTLEGVKVIRPPFVHEDHRGVNVETYNRRLYVQAGLFPPEFIQDSYSWSRHGVLRGIHGDKRTWKLVSCPTGKIYLVVVWPLNLSPLGRAGKWEAFELSGVNRLQVLIPPHYGNGHLVLSREAVFAYKLSEYTDTASQFTIRWNDPAYGIRWPITNPILSKRDGDA